MKVVMVVAIILWVWHLASNKFRGEDDIQKERGIKNNKNIEDAISSDKASAGDDEIALQAQVKDEKNGNPVILLWNNYQDDKITHYTKLFHR